MSGMVLYNHSLIQRRALFVLIMTQVNPSEPKSGSGVLIVLYAVGAAEGESILEVVRADLSTREGIAIPSELVENSVKVAANAAEVPGYADPGAEPHLDYCDPHAGAYGYPNGNASTNFYQASADANRGDYSDR